MQNQILSRELTESKMELDQSEYCTSICLETRLQISVKIAVSFRCLMFNDLSVRGQKKHYS